MLAVPLLCIPNDETGTTICNSVLRQKWNSPPVFLLGLVSSKINKALRLTMNGNILFED